MALGGMAKLEDLTSGAWVKGVLPDAMVTIIDVKWHGSSVVEARRCAQAKFAAKRGPKPQWSDPELLERFRAVLAASPFLGEGHRKVWARLRWQEIRTSKARSCA